MSEKIALTFSPTSYRYGNEGSEATTTSVEQKPVTEMVCRSSDIVEQVRALKEAGDAPAMVHVHPLSDSFKPIPGWPVCDEQGTVIEKGWYQQLTDGVKEVDPEMYVTGASAMLHLEPFLEEVKGKIKPLLEKAGPTALQGIVKRETIRKFVEALKLPEEQIRDCFEGVKFAHEKRSMIRKVSAHEAVTPEELERSLNIEETATLMTEMLVRGQALWAGMDGLPIISVHSLQAHNRYRKNTDPEQQPTEPIVALDGAFSRENLQSMGRYKHDIYLSPVLAHLCYQKNMVPEVEIQHPSQISMIEGYQKAGFLKQPLNCGFVIGMAITNEEGNTGAKSGKKDYAETVMQDVMEKLRPKSIRMVVVDRVNVPGDLEKSWELAWKLRDKYPDVVRAFDMGNEYTTRFKGEVNCSNTELMQMAAESIHQEMSSRDSDASLPRGDYLMSPAEYREGFKQPEVRRRGG